MLRALEQRMKSCKLTLHPEKTKIVNLRGWSEQLYARKYDFLGFCIRPMRRAVNRRWLLLPGTFVSQKSKKAIREVQGDGDTQAKSLDKRAYAEVESTHTRIDQLLPQVLASGYARRLEWPEPAAS